MARTKTVVTEVYKFSELSENAQDKAIQKLYDLNVDYEWWDSVYEDAKTIGLKLKGFDLDRHRHATGALTVSPLECIKLILTNHGESCDTYKLAKDFEQAFTDFEASKNREDDSFDQDEFDEAREDFEKALLEEYSIMLQHEYEYLTSREAIVESIECNNYEFDEDGNLA